MSARPRCPLVLAALIAPLTACLARPVPKAVAPKARMPPAGLEAGVRRAMAEQHIPGIAVAVVKDAHLAWTGAFGMADLERKVLVRTDSAFEIGSITKPFTASVVMMLVEAGKVRLEEKLSTYLPDVPAAWGSATVRQLLTHTSGIPNYMVQDTFDAEKDYTPDEIIKLVSDKPMDFAPGTGWTYSNTNFYLLGLLVQKVSGQSWSDFVAGRIFRPLGMKRTAIAYEAALIPDRALGYRRWQGKLWNAPLLHRGAAEGAGAILSTAPDLAKWAIALDAGKLLAKGSYRQMWTPARLNDGGATMYGFGWLISTRNGRSVISHGGGTMGFSAMLQRYPQDKLDVIVLTNVNGANVGAIADTVAGYFTPALKPAPAPQPKKDPDPVVTKRIHGILENLLSEKPDLTPFTPEVRARLTPQSLAAARKQLPGPLKPLQFLSRTSSPAGKVYRYRTILGATPLTIAATIAPDNQIAGLTAGPIMDVPGN